MSSTPTPLDDNQKNSNDERMYNAIDAVMKRTEQTYEDFVNSFSVLKKEDLAPKKPDSKQTPEGSEKLHDKMIQLADNLKAPTEELKPNQKSHDEESHDPKSHGDDTSPDQTKVSQENETDELHEEVLEEGAVCGWMSQAGNQRSSVQFDNFLDDKGDDISDNDDTGAGYTASFAARSSESPEQPPETGPQSTESAHQSHENVEQNANSETIGANTEQKSHSQESLKESQTVNEQGTTQKSNKKKKRRKKARNQTTEGASADHDTNNTDNDDQVEDNTPSAHESIETMKNILLETFLSDFCEEMGLGAMGNMDFGSLSEMGLDENDESPTENNGSGDDINFDEDPLELLMNITDTGLSNTDAYVKVSISKSNENDKSVSKSNENDKSVSKSNEDDDAISKCNDSGNADDKSEPGQSKKKKSRSRRRKKNKKNSGNSETGVENINKEQTVSEDNKQTAEDSRNIDEDKSKIESKQAPKSNGEDRNDKNKIKETVVSPEDKQSVSDSDEVSRTEPKNTSYEIDTTEQTEESFSGKLLFPGEVDDDDTTTSVTKETRLEFKATYSDCAGNDDASTTQDCSDEVEPFTLDQDFDYDNVVLTPKYSPEDMERLSQLMTGKIIL